MAAPRANWKGFLKFAEIAFPVALYTAASSSDRIAFHTVNRATGNRVRRIFIDSETMKPVERDDQVKGYEKARGDYVILEPEDVAAALPESDKTLNVESFIPLDAVDDVYFDKPYYLGPADKGAEEAYGLFRDGMRKAKVAAIARAVLFRRARTLLIGAAEGGLVAATLNFDYEVRPAKEAFEDIPKLKIQPEMVALARHIIDTKRGAFEPEKFTDRYEAALAELVKAKSEGRKIVAPKRAAQGKVVDLMAALRESAALAGKKPAAPKARATGRAAKPAARRKAS